MKVITIKQPFASLIAAGIKEYEFRAWKSKYRGKLLIHAGKGINKKAMEKFKCYNLEYPSGCIIAICDMVDCIKINDEVRMMLRDKNELVYHNVASDTSNEGYGFKLANVKKIEPIYVSGKLSLWDYDYKE